MQFGHYETGFIVAILLANLMVLPWSEVRWLNVVGVIMAAVAIMLSMAAG